LTEAEFVERVRRLGMERGITLDSGDIRDSLLDSLKKLARLAILSPWRSLLENNYDLTISGRSASFAANTDLLPESIKECNHITHASVVVPGTSIPLPFRILDDVSDLDFTASVTQSLFAFAAVGASAVEFRYSSALTGTLTVRAVKIPTLVSLASQPQLEDVLIDIGVGQAMKQAA
jgi:hypothetical protein